MVLLDRSGRNRHGSLVNMDVQDKWTGSGTGLALRFDGVNDYCAISPPSISLSRFSLCLWCNAVVTLAAFKGILISRSGGLSAGAGLFPNAGGLTAMWNGTAAEYNATTGLTLPPAGQWFFAAMIVDGPTVTTWLNGSSYSVAITETARDISGPWRLGADSFDPANRSSNVLVDDVRMYNRAITQAEIRLLASRRGIGLQAQTNRHATLPRKISINVANVWKDCDCYINDAGGVPRLTTPSQNIAGVWK